MNKVLSPRLLKRQLFDNQIVAFGYLNRLGEVREMFNRKEKNKPDTLSPYYPQLLLVLRIWQKPFTPDNCKRDTSNRIKAFPYLLICYDLTIPAKHSLHLFSISCTISPVRQTTDTTSCIPLRNFGT